MKSIVKTWLVGAAALASAAALAPAASAGCGAPFKLPAAYVTQGGQAASLLTLVDTESTTAAVPAAPSIVGLWTVQLFDKDNNQIDYGYMEWHADGTEFMQSVSRAPAIGNFCMGAWRQTGENTFSLNHFAISYDQSSGDVNAKIQIREQVTVDPANGAFTGHLSQDVYAPDGTTLLQHIHGHINGQRVTLKSTF